MTTHKRISQDYQITAVNNDNVTIDCHTLIVDGNLDVQGNVTYIETTELFVDDPFIVLANNNSGNSIANARYESQGIVTQSSADSFAGLRYNNVTDSWQISTRVNRDGSPGTRPYVDIGNAAAGSVAGPVYSLQFRDTGNVFGGSGDLIWNPANSSVALQGHLIVGNIGLAPAATANASSIYSAAVGIGGTGVYVKSDAVDEELVSRSKAIVFGIIF